MNTGSTENPTMVRFQGFIFQIKGMSAGEHQGPCNGSDAWKPPRAFGKNRAIELVAGTRNPYFYYNGQTTEKQPLPPPEATRWKTFSVFHNVGQFWTVPCDATAQHVYDGDDNDTPTTGNDSDSDSDSDTIIPRQDSCDWMCISFRKAKKSDLSFITHNGEQDRLIYQNRSQVWSELLLPDGHQKVHGGEDWDPLNSGMVGELPLSIALLALAVKPRHVHNVVPTLIHKLPWGIPDRVEHPRRCGWDDKRGVVVTIWTQDREMLENLEEGEYGSIF